MFAVGILGVLGASINPSRSRPLSFCFCRHTDIRRSTVTTCSKFSQILHNSKITATCVGVEENPRSLLLSMDLLRFLKLLLFLVCIGCCLTPVRIAQDADTQRLGAWDYENGGGIDSDERLVKHCVRVDYNWTRTSPHSANVLYNESKFNIKHLIYFYSTNRSSC